MLEEGGQVAAMELPGVPGGHHLDEQPVDVELLDVVDQTAQTGGIHRIKHAVTTDRGCSWPNDRRGALTKSARHPPISRLDAPASPKHPLLATGKTPDMGLGRLSPAPTRGLTGSVSPRATSLPLLLLYIGHAAATRPAALPLAFRPVGRDGAAAWAKTPLTTLAGRSVVNPSAAGRTTSASAGPFFP